VEQISFFNTTPKAVKKVIAIKDKTTDIGSKIKITIFKRENIGTIDRFSLTKKYAYVSYVYKDDPLQEVKYAYFNTKDELEIM
jgi:hypothetical protein